MGSKSSIPGKTDNFRVYVGGTDYVGTAEVTLPDIERLTDTIKGAGILGELDMPSNQFKAMSLKLSFNSTNALTAQLMKPGKQEIELRSVVTEFDNSEGDYAQTGRKYTIYGSNKKATGGKIAVGEKMGNEFEFSVFYYKEEIDGEESVEIDVVNYKYIVDGVDYLEEQRSLLGMN